MSRLVVGSGDPSCTAAWYSLSSCWPMSKDVNATGISGTNGLFAASSRLPLSTAVRPGLPSLKMTTPVAPAALALSTFTPKLQPPRWISAIRPDTKPLKSAAVQPLVELEVGVGGMTMPPAGWTSPLAVPLLVPGFQSVTSVKLRAVGDVSLHVGVPTNDV